MPPRFAYWTILVGGLPTAFRAAEREEIEPTFRRLQQKHPDAEMRWFARGKLWASPEEARDAWSRTKDQGQRTKDQDRDRSWRPGGSHRDPRQGYIDAKKRGNQKRRERRFEFKQGKVTSLKSEVRSQKPWEQRPKWTPPPGDKTPDGPKRAWNSKPQRDWRPETGDRRPPKTEDRRPKTDRPPQKSWTKPGPRFGDGQRPKAQGERPNADRPRPKWTDRPREDRPPPAGDRRPPPIGDRRPPPAGRGPGAARGQWRGPGKGPGPRGPKR